MLKTLARPRVVKIFYNDSDTNEISVETTQYWLAQWITCPGLEDCKFLGGIGNITLNRGLYLNYNSSSISIQIMLLPFLTVFSATFPLASLLAEVVISRYKLVSYSLRAIWIVH